MPKLDQRLFLKTAAASITLVWPTSVTSRSLDPATRKPSFSGDTAMREKVTSRVGFSTACLARMRDALASHVTRGDMPGLVTLISQRGGYTRVEALGTLTVGGKIPMRRDTIFRIASMSKPIIAAATMILVEDNKLHLDEPVDRLLPELAHRTVLKAP